MKMMRKVDLFGGADSGNDKIDNSVRKEGNNKTNDGVKDGVFGVGDLFTITSGDDIAETAPDKHEDRNGSYSKENSISELAEKAVRTDEIGWHFVSPSGVSAFTGAESNCSAGG